MTKRMVLPDGARGVDIDTPTGRISIDADSTGGIEIPDGQAQAILRSNGAVNRGKYIGFNVKGGVCTGCGWHSVLTKFTCHKCGVING